MNKFKKVSDDIYYFDEETKKFIKSKGKLIVLPGFESFDFALVDVPPSRINVTELVSGTKIRSLRNVSAKSKIRRAKQNLEMWLKKDAGAIVDMMGGSLEAAYVEAFEELIIKRVKKYGLSPRYKEIGK